MSKPPMKAIEQIKKYCEKTQCAGKILADIVQPLTDGIKHTTLLLIIIDCTPGAKKYPCIHQNAGHRGIPRHPVDA